MGEFIKTLVVKIKANSDASDSAMHSYGEELVNDIKSYLQNLRFDSWRQKVYTDWEESERVELEIEINETQNL
jgi:hypothetical protein